MTGYGRAKLSKDDREYQIEIKSVNHRYLDISVRIPKQLSYLEQLKLQKDLVLWKIKLESKLRTK